jgi:hypothetical protein
MNKARLGGGGTQGLVGKGGGDWRRTRNGIKNGSGRGGGDVKIRNEGGCRRDTEVGKE